MEQLQSYSAPVDAYTQSNKPKSATGDILNALGRISTEVVEQQNYKKEASEKLHIITQQASNENARNEALLARGGLDSFKNEDGSVNQQSYLDFNNEYIDRETETKLTTKYAKDLWKDKQLQMGMSREKEWSTFKGKALYDKNVKGLYTAGLETPETIWQLKAEAGDKDGLAINSKAFNQDVVLKIAETLGQQGKFQSVKELLEKKQSHGHSLLTDPDLKEEAQKIFDSAEKEYKDLKDLDGVRLEATYKAKFEAGEATEEDIKGFLEFADEYDLSRDSVVSALKKNETAKQNSQYLDQAYNNINSKETASPITGDESKDNKLYQEAFEKKNNELNSKIDSGLLKESTGFYAKASLAQRSNRAIPEWKRSLGNGYAAINTLNSNYGKTDSETGEKDSERFDYTNSLEGFKVFKQLQKNSPSLISSHTNNADERRFYTTVDSLTKYSGMTPEQAIDNIRDRQNVSGGSVIDFKNQVIQKKLHEATKTAVTFGGEWFDGISETTVKNNVNEFFPEVEALTRYYANYMDIDSALKTASEEINNDLILVDGYAVYTGQSFYGKGNRPDPDWLSEASKGAKDRYLKTLSKKTGSSYKELSKNFEDRPTILVPNPNNPTQWILRDAITSNTLDFYNQQEVEAMQREYKVNKNK